MKKDTSTYKIFDCGYCGCEFEARIGSAGENHSKVSTQVKCPLSNNYQPNKKGRNKPKLIRRK